MGKKVLYFLTSEDITGVELASEHTEEDAVTILLLQNAVYFANKTNEMVSKALDKKVTIVANKEDTEVRGIKNFISDKIKSIAYDEVVDLIFANNTIINM
jgi:sulfur relay protein TusB/DsrH